jgi:hypothetical protein
MIHQRYIELALIPVVLVGGTILVVHRRSQAPDFSSTTIPSAPSPTIAAVPTPAWYEAHRDVLKKDNCKIACNNDPLRVVFRVQFRPL